MWMGDGNAKYLIGDAASHHYPMPPRGAWLNLLRQRCTHQHIAQIDYQAHGDNLNICSLCRHECIYAIFTSRSTGEETAEEPLSSNQSSLFGNYAKREGDGKVAQSYGYAIVQAVNDVTSFHLQPQDMLLNSYEYTSIFAAKSTKKFANQQ